MTLQEAEAKARVAAEATIDQLVKSTIDNFSVLDERESDVSKEIERLEALKNDSKLLNELITSYVAWLAKTYVILPPKQAESEGEHLRPSEVAALVRKDPTTVRRWIKAGFLPAVRLPGHPDKANYLIRREDVERLLEITPTRGEEGDSILENLTVRENEILRRVAERKNDEEIAKELFISPRTIRHHLLVIHKKLNTSSRSELVAYALHHGLA